MNKERMDKLCNAAAMETAVHVVNARMVREVPMAEACERYREAVKQIVVSTESIQDQYVRTVWKSVAQIDPKSPIWTLARELFASDALKHVIGEQRPGIMGWLPTESQLVNIIRDKVYDLWKRSGKEIDPNYKGDKK